MLAKTAVTWQWSRGGLPALLRVAAAFCCGLLPATLAAATVARADNGFMVSNEAVIAAPVETTWRALLAIGNWWDPEHTYSGDAARMSLDAIAGGCFCEDIGDGASIRHGEVIYVAPLKVLRIAGALGPLQEEGVAGSLTFSLAPDADGTRLLQTYSVGGFRAGGLGELADVVNGVLGTQLRRLHSFVETGTPLLPALTAVQALP